MNKSKNKKGLGRGLKALFGDQKQSDNKNKTSKNSNNVRKANLSDLSRNRYQPRNYFDETKLTELSNSIKKNGIIQPIAVREDKLDRGRYEIIAGERRWLAAQKAGLHEVPIVVLDVDDNEALEIAIIENIQRDDLNIVEEAKGYQRLFDEFKYDHDKIAKFMSKSRSHISNTLRLLTLPKDVIAMIEEGNLTAGQARPLIGLPSATNIAEEIVAKKLSARSVELLVRSKKGPQKNSQYKMDSNIVDEQNAIQDNLGLNVIIQNKRNNSGKITIAYKNLEQFELVSGLLKKS
ncbi:MAG: chromosome partitioning protein ParB [Candidatus Pelagibacter sp. TMED197]|nr:chromosome partitioning protein ParB [Candidatus Pelagibacter sp.]OUW58642.1 MAG: chromosome partitioning protein ParB [Candidatus Pelagibacter sp. TMED197]